MDVCRGFIPFKKNVWGGGLLFGALVLAGASSADVVLNEFLADPAGSDGGREFVELLNNGTSAVDLEQVELQFANGAVGADWQVRWRGAGHGWLAAGEVFLIVDRNWLGPVPGDAEVYLGLQNGPDALRLVRESTVLDLVGYGALTDAELFEGQPVPTVAGKSLARRPDGHDTQNNRSDFVAALPTPGNTNFLPYSLTLVDHGLEPAFLARPGDLLQVRFTLLNDGTKPLPGARCQLAWPSGVAESWWDGAEPDDELTLSFAIHLAHRGTVALTWQYLLPDVGDTLRVPVAEVQVGSAALRLNEVLPAPDQGQGEWVELQWLGPASLDLAGYQLRDEEGHWVPLPSQVLFAGDYFVVAEDSVALAGWWQANQGAGGEGCDNPRAMPARRLLGSWPSLNNSPPASRLYADQLYLADPHGVVIDAVAWGGADAKLPDRGLSLERLAAEPVNPGAVNWAVSTALSGSSPGCANSVTRAANSSVVGGGLTVVPPVLEPVSGITVSHILFELLSDEYSWEVRIFNLWGDLVRDFGGDARGAGPRDLIWDGKGDYGGSEPPGAYVVWLETRTADGAVVRREKVRLVVR